MRAFLRVLILIFPVMLIAFEPHPVTPYPVVGYEEVPFDEQRLLIWYPVDPQVEGTPSKSRWDVFNVAIGAPLKTSESKMAVIAISHGYGGTTHQLSWLIRYLVYSGYIVIGTDHRDRINHKHQINHWQRPQDISKIIDKFSSHPMASHANLNQIGIAGFSLGGTTAIWLAGGRATKLKSIVPGPKDAHLEEFRGIEAILPSLNKKMMSKDWRDPRIKAAFVMAPAWGWVFDEKNLSKISIPTYLIASSADHVIFTQNNAAFFARNIPKSTYQEISGKAGHYIFITALNEKQKQELPAKVNFLIEDDVSIDRAWIQSEVSQEAARFFNSVFK
jgi:predicted dienelactone hydrolase